ncbi:Cytochrome P450 71D10 [Vitis vinifera]|uniref:Cytochrome P450 71D10 n=1 Tax=Vitis vinifera TaxID=29760 RepID=A0A438J716_VITVI|nr:Cytochrome P450 71D10 [Vitis vinifera]
MDGLFSCILFASLLFLYMLYKIGKRWRGNISSQKLPPGPWKLPLIGNMHQLIDGSLPHHSLSRLAKQYGPLMSLQLGEISTLIISSPEMAKQILKTHDINFAQRASFLATNIVSYHSTDIIFSPYGNYWRQLRKICVVELLTSKRVKSFQLIREEELSNLITTLASCSRLPINLTDKLSSGTFAIIARAAFGEKCKEQDAFISVLKETLELVSGPCVADMYPSVKWLDLISGMRHKIEKVFKRTDRILQNIVDEHREKMKTEAGKLQGEEDLVDDIFAGGGETTSISVEWAMSEMLKNPRVMDKAQAEECREMCEINGYEIPKKTLIIVNAWAIGRDSDHWVEAERFYPERFLDSSIDYKGTDFGYIPFGAGRRMCPGILFSLPIIELSLAHLLYNFDWKLPNGMKADDLDMTEAFGITVRRKQDLHLIPIPNNPWHVQ